MNLLYTITLSGEGDPVLREIGMNLGKVRAQKIYTDE